MVEDSKKILNLSEYSSQKLCEIIVCNRYLNFDPDFSTNCMQELVKRRLNGDEFDFENYIEKTFNELPEIEISVPDLSSIFDKFKIFKIPT
jgi:hypothetical protein